MVGCPKIDGLRVIHKKNIMFWKKLEYVRLKKRHFFIGLKKFCPKIPFLRYLQGIKICKTSKFLKNSFFFWLTDLNTINIQKNTLFLKFLQFILFHQMPQMIDKKVWRYVKLSTVL